MKREGSKESMTKQELEQVAILRDEYRRIEKQVDNLPEKKRWAETVQMSSTDAACRLVESAVISEEGDDVETRLLKRRYRDAKAKYIDAYEAALDYIGSLQDVRVQRILTLRYLDDMSLQDVAEALAYSYSHVNNLIVRHFGK